MRLEICLKIQIRQKFWYSSKEPQWAGQLQEQHLPDQALHFYRAKGQHAMCSDGVEHVRMARGQGAHTTFSEGGIPHYCAFPPQLRVETSHWNLLYILGK